jgi:hypothetical protein
MAHNDAKNYNCTMEFEATFFYNLINLGSYLMLDAFSVVLDRVMVRRLVKQLVLMDN